MEVGIFAIRDTKAEAYLQPFFSQTKGTAIRAFTDAVNDSKSQFSRYPADFVLFELGGWDDDTGSFTLHKTPISLGLAKEFVDPARSVVPSSEQ